MTTTTTRRRAPCWQLGLVVAAIVWAILPLAGSSGGPVRVGSVSYAYDGGYQLLAGTNASTFSRPTDAPAYLRIVSTTEQRRHSEAATGFAAEESGGALRTAACGLSFSAGTPVLLANGKTKPISKLTVGDKVLAADTGSSKNRSQTVQAVLINHDTDLLDLVVIDTAGHRSVVHTTAKHPIWDQTTHRWVRAGNLPAGELLRTADGQALRVLKLLTPKVTSGHMWDLTVSNDHNFFVGSSDTAILVHNCDAAAMTESAARRAAFRAHNVPTSEANNFERVEVYGQNMNMRGPQGEPWQVLKTADVNGSPVEIQNHMWGHVFDDTGEIMGPHYLGPSGEQLFYTS